MLLNHGSLEGARVLGRKTVEYMTSDHLGTQIAHGAAYSPGPGYGFGLGFAVRKDTGVAGLTGSAGDYNWGGAFGTASGSISRRSWPSSSWRKHPARSGCTIASC